MQLNRNNKSKGNCEFCYQKNYTTEVCSSKKVVSSLREQISKESIYKKRIKPEEHSTD
jgi:radical SAM superfamily enzyme